MLVYNGHNVARVPNRAASEQEMVFLPLLQPHQEEIRKIVGDTYHCHELVVEDCLRFGQRPKLNVYTDHAFFPFFFLRDDWELVQIGIVMGHNFVIAILPKPMPFLSELEEEFQKTPEKMKNPGRILYEFLDLCVHHYLDFVDSIEDTVDAMESQIYDNPQTSVAPEIFSLKRTLHRTRRVFSEERNVVESLMHAAFPYTKQEDNVYLMDLYEHINRIVDGIDSFRDSLSGLLDLQMAIKSDRMNAIMKTLTIVSTFFMPLSFIVGLYGMNVKVPEYGWRYGYVWVWAWILASVFGLFLFFRKKRWF
ncbi:magnesium/cobalt transporter CorA [Alicyclobacillus dauci]|uniref:Magnesium transport protein CorA n=1 Tax=Alicyclobacillus dauci TaxID=1475485 RepID=A0ABY6Z7C4_9BACL|nr:magnesium/cobalt transporter CorA [Alicyclobacillus dauci]WAH38787.1 magnesium/cobalt transporter CorA [Alicyclobacillus dauci]